MAGGRQPELIASGVQACGWGHTHASGCLWRPAHIAGCFSWSLPGCRCAWWRGKGRTRRECAAGWDQTSFTGERMGAWVGG